jgi:hypothetical protein
MQTWDDNFSRKTMAFCGWKAEVMHPANTSNYLGCWMSYMKINISIPLKVAGLINTIIKPPEVQKHITIKINKTLSKYNHNCWNEIREKSILQTTQLMQLKRTYIDNIVKCVGDVVIKVLKIQTTWIKEQVIFKNILWLKPERVNKWTASLTA